MSDKTHSGDLKQNKRTGVVLRILSDEELRTRDAAEMDEVGREELKWIHRWKVNSRLSGMKRIYGRRMP